MRVSFYATLRPIVGDRSVEIPLAGRDIRWLEGVETPLQPGQEVDIFPPVAGG